MQISRNYWRAQPQQQLICHLKFLKKMTAKMNVQEKRDNSFFAKLRNMASMN
jgi:hypothetical protein